MTFTSNGSATPRRPIVSNTSTLLGRAYAPAIDGYITDRLTIDLQDDIARFQPLLQRGSVDGCNDGDVATILPDFYTQSTELALRRFLQ